MATSIAQGTSVNPGDIELIVEFDEDMDFSSVDASDVNLIHSIFEPTSLRRYPSLRAHGESDFHIDARRRLHLSLVELFHCLQGSVGFSIRR